jgi:hypothetical protein
MKKAGITAFHAEVKNMWRAKFNLTLMAINLALPYKNQKADERSRK